MDSFNSTGVEVRGMDGHGQSCSTHQVDFGFDCMVQTQVVILSIRKSRPKEIRNMMSVKFTRSMFNCMKKRACTPKIRYGSIRSEVIRWLPVDKPAVFPIPDIWGTYSFSILYKLDFVANLTEVLFPSVLIYVLGIPYCQSSFRSTLGY